MPEGAHYLEIARHDLQFCIWYKYSTKRVMISNTVINVVRTFQVHFIMYICTPVV